MSSSDKKQIYQKLAKLLLGFSGLCFLTSFIFNVDSGSGAQIKQTLPHNGGYVGPIQVNKRNSVYNIEVQKDIRQYGRWSFVGGDVLDAEKQFLFGFGQELWKESGYDSDGPWYEENTSFDLKVTFPQSGVYYLRFKEESNSSERGNIMVSVSPKVGSSLAHFMLGVVSLIGMLVLLVLGAEEIKFGS